MNVDQACAAAADIPGWCDTGEMRWLVTQAQARHCIVEVGCWQGRSIKAMAQVAPGEVYAIDDWRGAGGKAANGWHGPDGFPLGVDDTPHEELERRFRANLKAELASGKVIAPNVGSPDAAERFRPGQVDMVYIDGNHDTQPVIDDLRAWRAVLAPGGLLCGHDALDPRVAAALDAEGVAYEIVVDNVWRAL